MILLIGHGYIGSAFWKEICTREIKCRLASHIEVNGFWKAHEYLKNLNPELVINCAAYIPKRSVQDCDLAPAETILGNIIFPAMLNAACADQGIPFAHISTGCLWNDGLEHDEEELIQRAFTGHCGFYIGGKVLAEEEVRKCQKHYIWRVRLPFDEFDNDRNYLSKLASFNEVWMQENSACHRRDFVKACLDLWDRRAPFGTYNMTNPGVLNVTDVVTRMQRIGIIQRVPHLIDKKDGECRLSCSKLLSTGVQIRPIYDALDEALSNWVSR